MPAVLTQRPASPDLCVTGAGAQVEVHVFGTITVLPPIPIHPGSATPRSPVPPPGTGPSAGGPYTSETSAGRPCAPQGAAGADGRWSHSIAKRPHGPDRHGPKAAPGEAAPAIGGDGELLPPRSGFVLALSLMISQLLPHFS